MPIVQVGPSESSLLGNGCVQLIGLGAIGSLDEARLILRRSFDASEVEPRGAVPDAVLERFAGLGPNLGGAGTRAAPREAARGVVS